MLATLKKFHDILKSDIGSADDWSSLLIDYELPYVDRLWKQVGHHRVCLHKIHPFDEGEPYFHSHKWPFAVKILKGSYLMGYGVAEGLGKALPPPVQKVIKLVKGDTYELLSELEWHYIKPVGKPSYSLAVTGPPFNLDEPKTHPQLRTIPHVEKNLLLGEFKSLLAG